MQLPDLLLRPAHFEMSNQRRQLPKLADGEQRGVGGELFEGLLETIVVHVRTSFPPWHGAASRPSTIRAPRFIGANSGDDTSLRSSQGHRDDQGKMGLSVAGRALPLPDVQPVVSQ